MKTLIRLKKDMAAIIFTPQGCQLVYPERAKGEELPEHFSFAASITMAIQYQVFVDGMFAFLRDVTKEEGVTH